LRARLAIFLPETRTAAGRSSWFFAGTCAIRACRFGVRLSPQMRARPGSGTRSMCRSECAEASSSASRSPSGITNGSDDHHGRRMDAPGGFSKRWRSACDSASARVFAGRAPIQAPRRARLDGRGLRLAMGHQLQTERLASRRPEQGHGARHDSTGKRRLPRDRRQPGVHLGPELPDW